MAHSGQRLYGRNTRPKNRSFAASEPPHGWPGTAKRARWNFLRKERVLKAYQAAGKLLFECELCGQLLRHIGTHFLHTHKMTKLEYAEAIGHRKLTLVAPDLRLTRPLEDILRTFALPHHTRAGVEGLREARKDPVYQAKMRRWAKLSRSHDKPRRRGIHQEEQMSP